LIVHQGVVGDSVDLVLVHPDGTGSRSIPGGPGNRWHPDWSPDGLRIAYDTNRAADDVAEIGVVGTDGSDEHLLQRCDGTCYGNGGPAWSPDGSTIAYDAAEGPTSEHAGDLCYIGLFDLATSTAARILAHPDCDPADSYVRWSPDGGHLMFQRTSGQRMALFSASADGTDERQLTDWGTGARPDWSPDGDSIVLMDQDDCDCDRQTVGLSVIEVDGTGLRRLTPTTPGIADVHPRWLPDRSAIIFSRCDGFDCEVHLVAPDGSDDRALPLRATGLVHPVWQPWPAGT
jgi:Tol biopolymer transport system component